MQWILNVDLNANVPKQVMQVHDLKSNHFLKANVLSIKKNETKTGMELQYDEEKMAESIMWIEKLLNKWILFKVPSE